MGKIERAGFVRKHGAEFHVGNRSVLPRHVEFAKGWLPGVDYTYQVERADFDQILLDHAAEAGCEVRQETKVTGVESLPGDTGYRVTIRAADGTGEDQTFTARFVADASGRDQLLPSRSPTPRRTRTSPNGWRSARISKGCPAPRAEPGATSSSSGTPTAGRGSSRCAGTGCRSAWW